MSEDTFVDEGSAKVGFSSLNEVFYNPVQRFNRDISICVIGSFIREKLQLSDEEFSKIKGIKKSEDGIRILEALSASGLRSIRYAKELSGVNEIIANDWSDDAVETIRKNVELNGVSDIVFPSKGDATMVMHENKRNKFDIVDLDPYGSPTPFLDGAVQCVADGGLLCVTCTDMAVLCGNAADSCRTKYGSVSLKAKCCHEMALRIVLQTIETHANRYGRYIEPLLSLSIDFYVRIFVRVRSSQQKAKASVTKSGNVFFCTGCESLTPWPSGVYVDNSKFKLAHGPPVGPKCEFCDHKHVMGGPFWLGNIHDKLFVRKLLETLKLSEENSEFGTLKRMQGMLSVVEEELEDVPFYYVHDRLSSLIRAGSGKINEIRSAILNAGYKVSQSHCHRLAIKTDAPNDFIWDMMRAWKAKDPGKKEAKEPVAMAILSKESSRVIKFHAHPDANPASRENQLVRFQVNPEKNWGPKMKSTTTIQNENENDKRKRNQGKYSKGKKKKYNAENETEEV